MVSELDMASFVCLRGGADSWGPQGQYLDGARGPSRAYRGHEPLRPVSAPSHASERGTQGPCRAGGLVQETHSCRLWPKNQGLTTAASTSHSFPSSPHLGRGQIPTASSPAQKAHQERVLVAIHLQMCPPSLFPGQGSHVLAMVGSLPPLPPQRTAFSPGRSEPLQATQGHDCLQLSSCQIPAHPALAMCFHSHPPSPLPFSPAPPPAPSREAWSVSWEGTTDSWQVTRGPKCTSTCSELAVMGPAVLRAGACGAE